MIDVVITSASRPKLIPYLMESFIKTFHYSGKFNKIWHEDFVYPKESKKVISIVKNWADVIIKHNPPIKIGGAYKKMFDSHIKSKFMFNLQDDWEFELPIDLDHILYVMENNKNINCIFFNKRRNLKSYSGETNEEVKVDNLILSTYKANFPFLPGIWRTEFVKKYWKVSENNKPQEGWFNKNLKHHNINDFGCYSYGGLGFPRVIRHLGYSWAVKSWGTHPNRGQNGYGGNVKLDFVDPERAEWLPIEPKRPQFLSNKQDDIEELIKQGILDESYRSK